MRVSFGACEEHLDRAAGELFDSDLRIQAVGISRHGRGFGFKAIRNARRILPLLSVEGSKGVPAKVGPVPVIVQDVSSDIEAHTPVPQPPVASLVPELQFHRPLVSGLQIQNFDDDIRERQAGRLGVTHISVGTAGCFVRLSDARVAVLTNNHVLAGHNRGVKGQDRILQPGSVSFTASEQVAVLSDFVPLNPSPAGARPALGNVVFNAVDAAVAALTSGVLFTNGYLASRQLPAIQGVATASHGDAVFKVGRRTGLTRGTITQTAVVTGPIQYAPGPCWFQNQLEITGDNGTMFSDHGDSGSAVVNSAGQVVGLLYAGNGTQSYACRIQDVFSALKCVLA